MYSSAGWASLCFCPTCLWRRPSWGTAKYAFKGGRFKPRNHGRGDAFIGYGTGVPYDLSFTFRYQLVMEGIESNPGPSPVGSSAARRAHSHHADEAPSPAPSSSSSVHGGLSPSRLPARPRPAANQAWGSVSVLAMLGLRRFVAVGNGHCCVYSVAHQLDFQNADPSLLAFNISDADCLGLRQKAYDLLTTPGDFLSGCLAPFEGNTSPCCGIAGCRAFSIRLKCAKNTERSPDGKPVEWTEGVLKPLLKMGSSPGYVGDHFLCATAILFRRDIVVLSEPGGRRRQRARSQDLLRQLNVVYDQSNEVPYQPHHHSKLHLRPRDRLGRLRGLVRDWQAAAAQRRRAHLPASHVQRPPHRHHPQRRIRRWCALQLDCAARGSLSAGLA